MFSQAVSYNEKDTVLKGFLVYDDSNKEQRPAILVGHDWSGCNEFAKNKAKELAELGYVAFVWDMYGEGTVGTTTEEKSRLMQPFMDDRALLRQRVLAAYNELIKQPLVDQSRIGAIGYCFGGLCVLDLARSGANLRGVVSFHGFFNAPKNLPDKKITAKILAFQGAEDPMVPLEQIFDFKKEMAAQNVNWQVHIFSDAMHGFTNPAANDTKLGIIYNAVDAKRAWQGMKDFFVEVFA